VVHGFDPAMVLQGIYANLPAGRPLAALMRHDMIGMGIRDPAAAAGEEPPAEPPQADDVNERILVALQHIAQLQCAQMTQSAALGTAVMQAVDRLQAVAQGQAEQRDAQVSVHYCIIPLTACVSACTLLIDAHSDPHRLASQLLDAPCKQYLKADVKKIIFNRLIGPVLLRDIWGGYDTLLAAVGPATA
jgi:hypothetical protein